MTQPTPIATRTSAGLLERVTAARQRGVAWLTDRVADDGTPEGADSVNSWWRAPWALCLGGAPDAAAAMLGWIEREALTDDGELRGGVYGGGGPGSPVYHVSPIAIAAWLLGRYGTSSAIMDSLQQWTDDKTGGAFDKRDFQTDPVQDMLKTSQLGVTALVTGRRATADGVYSWLQHAYEAQPELPTRLYTSKRSGELVVQAEGMEAFLRVVDFSKPRQAYFQPGIAAAFLAGYAGQTSTPGAIDLAAKYLSLSEQGTEEQYDDITSVQVCKVGWGHAALYSAAPTPQRRVWVEKLGEWFVTRQRPDGAWAPASFVTPNPELLDLYWKTAEHVMELSYIEQALLSGRRDTA